MGVVAPLHLGEEQWEQIVAKVDAAPQRRTPGIGQLTERLGRAHHGLVVTVGVDAVRRLGAVGNPRPRVEVDVRFAAARYVALAITHVLERAPAADRRAP